MKDLGFYTCWKSTKRVYVNPFEVVVMVTTNIVNTVPTYHLKSFLWKLN